MFISVTAVADEGPTLVYPVIAAPAFTGPKSAGVTVAPIVMAAPATMVSKQAALPITIDPESRLTSYLKKKIRVRLRIQVLKDYLQV